MTQERTDAMYMRVCDILAEQSMAKRSQVGAVVVKDNNIISMGFNGTPSGFDNCCEYAEPCQHNRTGCEIDCIDCSKGILHTKPEVLHAESNALMKLVRRGGESALGATLYCSLSPCLECAKLIIQAGIARVVYAEQYRIADGIELLEKAGIKVDKFDGNYKFWSADYEVYAEPVVTDDDGEFGYLWAGRVIFKRDGEHPLYGETTGSLYETRLAAKIAALTDFVKN